MIDQGLLQRQRRVIPFDRIQAVESVRKLRHRLFGVVELRIETVGGASTEGKLERCALGTRNNSGACCCVRRPRRLWSRSRSVSRLRCSQSRWCWPGSASTGSSSPGSPVTTTRSELLLRCTRKVNPLSGDAFLRQVASSLARGSLRLNLDECRAPLLNDQGQARAW
ncbi:MAG: PH domain-containing protein [Euzebyales bacterium]|nr:PH domain-containing protein [Euzebyales bacterium]